MTGDTDSSFFSRRQVLQSLGAGAASTTLAGCLGGESDESGEDSKETGETDTSTTTEEDPDYELPESEHMDLGQMARYFGTIFPGGSIMNGWSPQQIDDETDMGYEQNGILLYDPFGFEYKHIPETLSQTSHENQQDSVRVDQLPGDVTRSQLEEQLEDRGFERVREDGDFTVYKHPNIVYGDSDDSRSEARAVSDNYHLAAYNSSYSGGGEKSADFFLGQLDTVLNHHQSEEMQMNDHAQDVLEMVDAGDYLAIASSDEGHYEFVRIEDEFQPLAAVLTGNLDGDKRAVWKFGEEIHAEEIYNEVEGSDILEGLGYDSVERDGVYLVADGQFSDPEDGDLHERIPHL